MPDSMSSHTHAGVGDSVSLFENPEGSISGESGSSDRPVQNSVLDSINVAVLTYFGDIYVICMPEYNTDIGLQLHFQYLTVNECYN
ncbi:unnamed protein product [Trichobilharzia regenti]|nr:unnamed protein product [Trichobilharzia regenti]